MSPGRWVSPWLWAWHCPLPAATALLGVTITRGKAHRGLLLSEGEKGLKAQEKLAGVWQQQEQDEGSCQQPTIPSVGSTGLGDCREAPGHAGLRGRSWMMPF